MLRKNGVSISNDEVISLVFMDLDQMGVPKPRHSMDDSEVSDYNEYKTSSPSAMSRQQTDHSSNLLNKSSTQAECLFHR